jgi:CRP-like cAMP-binding protein
VAGSRPARRINWLTVLPADETAGIRAASTARTYRPRELIFGPTPTPQHVYLLEKGLVRIYRTSPDGAALTLGYVRPGEVFGDVAVIAESSRDVCAEASVASNVLRIPREVFTRVLRTHNPVLYEITKTMSQRLVRIRSRAEDLVFHDARRRLARLLVRLAEEFGDRRPTGLAVGVPLTQEEMATLVGTSRQTVNSVLRDLISGGLVARKGRELLLTNQAALQRVAGLD